MGEVYKARDAELGRDVAVTVLPSSFSADRDRLSRFKQEACAAGALNHPNILVVHDIGAHDAPYVVLELLQLRVYGNAAIVTGRIVSKVQGTA